MADQPMIPVLTKWPKDLLDRLDAQAMFENVSRSVYIRTAVAKELGFATPAETVPPPRVNTCPHPKKRVVASSQGLYCTACETWFA